MIDQFQKRASLQPEAEKQAPSEAGWEKPKQQLLHDQEAQAMTTTTHPASMTTEQRDQARRTQFHGHITEDLFDAAALHFQLNNVEEGDWKPLFVALRGATEHDKQAILAYAGTYTWARYASAGIEISDEQSQEEDALLRNELDRRIAEAKELAEDDDFVLSEGENRKD